MSNLVNRTALAASLPIEPERIVMASCAQVQKRRSPRQIALDRVLARADLHCI